MNDTTAPGMHLVSAYLFKLLGRQSPEERRATYTEMDRVMDTWKAEDAWHAARTEKRNTL